MSHGARVGEDSGTEQPQPPAGDTEPSPPLVDVAPVAEGPAAPPAPVTPLAPPAPVTPLAPPAPPAPPAPVVVVMPPLVVPVVLLPISSVQRPATHTPLPHGAPSGFAAYVHVLVARLQLPACLHTLSGAPQITSWFVQTPIPLQGSTVWQASSAVHSTFFPEHTPFEQVSPVVQPTWSLQSAPSSLGKFEHVPVLGSQAPGSWQVSGSAHVTGFPPTQRPATHVSVWVHLFVSSQIVPSGFDVLAQTPVDGSHTPAI